MKIREAAGLGEEGRGRIRTCRRSNDMQEDEGVARSGKDEGSARYDKDRKLKWI